jgi:hypothetical protein
MSGNVRICPRPERFRRSAVATALARVGPLWPALACFGLLWPALAVSGEISLPPCNAVSGNVRICPLPKRFRCPLQIRFDFRHLSLRCSRRLTRGVPRRFFYFFRARFSDRCRPVQFAERAPALRQQPARTTPAGFDGYCSAFAKPTRATITLASTSQPRWAPTSIALTIATRSRDWRLSTNV